MYRLIHRYRLTVLLLGLMLFVLLVVGLAPVSLNASTQESDRFVAVAGSDIASSLDPAMNYDNEAIIQIYETLLWFDKETNAYVPRVATHWEVTNSGKDFTFHIRKNIKFHDGSLLQAHDIAYSIQRGLLQSDSSSQQWLFIQPIMGYGSGDITDEINGGPFYGDRADLLANGDANEMRMTCEKVKQHVTADDDAGTVTIHTEQGDASFLTTLAAYGFILDEEWTKAQGDWDGSCDTWQNYYGPSSTEAGSLLDQETNGSGPFKHTDGTQGVEMILQRHDNYWAGPVALREISYKVVDDENSRLQMLLDGQADRAALSTLEPPADKVRLEYSGDDLTLVNEIGVLNSYMGEPRPVATDLFFTFAIETAGGNPYVGSGQLDGNGIPPDFFDNIHARKAFSYAFDYEAYNNQSFNGRAIRRTGPIAANLMGYSPLQPTYDFDPAKAKQEFMQVLGDKGFRMTIVYNTGNSSRETAAKILEQGIEALDPKYQIDVVGIANSDMLKEWGDGKLPVAFGGWSEDYHHPNNWLEPWLFGGYLQIWRGSRKICKTSIARTRLPARI